MLDALVLAGEFVQRVRVVTGHEDEDHSGALPPHVVFVALREEEPGREADRNGLPGSWPFESQQLSDAVS